MWEKFDPPTYRSRGTAHAQWLQTHCQQHPIEEVRTHNSRTDSLSTHVISERRPSVCRLSVTLMHPTQSVEIFGNISMPFGTLVIR